MKKNWKFLWAVLAVIFFLTPVSASAKEFFDSKGKTATVYAFEQLDACLVRQTQLYASDQTFKSSGEKKNQYSNGYYSSFVYDTCWNYNLVSERQGWFELNEKDLQFNGRDAAKLKANVFAYDFYSGSGGFWLDVDLRWKPTKTWYDSKGQTEELDGTVSEFKNFYQQTTVTGVINDDSGKAVVVDYIEGVQSAIYSGYYRFELD